MIWNNSKRAFLARMLILIILACHGAYGINHHHVYETALSHEVGEAVPSGDPYHQAGEQATDTGYFTYFMTLLTLLAGLYLFAAKRYSTIPPDSRRHYAYPSRIRNRLLRLPTRSSTHILQVYRL